jgi:hypothetical protein
MHERSAMPRWFVRLPVAVRIALIAVVLLLLAVAVGLVLDPQTWLDNFWRGVNDAS